MVRFILLISFFSFETYNEKIAALKKIVIRKLKHVNRKKQHFPFTTKNTELLC
jgi:hypothetical protein